jgi:rhomboid protease GluP
LSDDVLHDEGPEGVELARYPRLQDARERGLVVTTMDLPHWIVRHGREYALCVESRNRERVLAAIAEFEADERSRGEERKLEPFQIPKFAVLITVLIMGALYRVQIGVPPAVVERGIADDLLIRSGEWWRCFTALTLHGDSEHLLSNLSFAFVVFAFAYGRFGVGFGLLGTVFGGALGNALNSFVRFSEAHRSLGSSTALFAALGLLSGAELIARLQQKGRARWPLMVPIGVAIAFLGLFGGAGGVKPDGTPIPIVRVDLGAHLFGLAAGVFAGALLYRFGATVQANPRAQFIAGAVCFFVLPLAWWMAVGR